MRSLILASVLALFDAGQLPAQGFRQKDFDEPDTSPLFQELLQLPDLQVRQLTMHIRQALQRPLRQTPWLEDILPRRSIRPSGAKFLRRITIG